MKTIVTIGVGLVLLAGLGYGGFWVYQRFYAAQPVHYRTVAAKLGDLHATIGATGTVEPEEVVDVGAQVAGQVLNFGPDPKAPGKTIDYGSVVEEGTLLARIDDALYKADVESATAAVEVAKANLGQAQANVLQAKANVDQMQAKLVQASNDWDRAQKVGPSDALSQNDYDNYQALYLVAKANREVSDAAVVQAQAAVNQAQAGVDQAAAALHHAQSTEDYCTIKSPVKGVVIDRRVNIGQTVVAALNTPSMFLIAKDLTRIQVWVSVNEADIGNISVDQRATFTVDAFPGRVFEGKVAQIRLNATMTQNVVTYTVVVSTDNSSGKLLPYLTANVQFDVGDRTGALLVPNAALRWSPTPQQMAPDVRGAGSGRGRPRADASGSADEEAAAPPGAASRPADRPRPATASRNRGTVWVQDGVYVRPIRVRLGLTDGTNTEILADARGGKLDEGTPVITGELRPGEEASDVTNPFLPQFRGMRR